MNRRYDIINLKTQCSKQLLTCSLQVLWFSHSLCLAQNAVVHLTYSETQLAQDHCLLSGFRKVDFSMLFIHSSIINHHHECCFSLLIAVRCFSRRGWMGWPRWLSRWPAWYAQGRLLSRWPQIRSFWTYARRRWGVWYYADQGASERTSCYACCCRVFGTGGCWWAGNYRAFDEDGISVFLLHVNQRSKHINT